MILVAKIRDDLFGVAHVHVKSGTIVLKAGDTVPRGVKVGKHLTEVEEEPAAPVAADVQEVSDSDKGEDTDEGTDFSK